MTIGVMLVAAFLFLSRLSAVKATLSLTTTVVETLSAGAAPYADAGKNSITHSGLNLSRNLDANSGAGLDADTVVYGKLAMTAGAATLNLAAVTGLNGDTIDLTGKKIRFAHWAGDAANSNPITVAKGASNGYTGFGAAYSETLDAGRHTVKEANQTAVSASVRTLDVTGTGTQVLDFMIVAGPN